MGNTFLGIAIGMALGYLAFTEKGHEYLGLSYGKGKEYYGKGKAYYRERK